MTGSSSPQPRKGFFFSQLDSFIGPGATRAEIILQFGSSFVIGMVCYLVFLENSDNESLSSWKHKIAVIVLGMDMIGGVVTNSTSAAKRWYHRQSQGMFEHMTFIANHAMQIGAVSFLFVPDRNEQWVYFGLVYGSLLISSMVVLLVPLYLQRPTAMALVATSIPLSMSRHVLPTTTSGMEWFIPLLFMKLLVSHLTYETPFQPSDNTKKKKKTTNKL